MAVGVGATLAYQKYGKQMMNRVESTVNRAVKQTTKKLENMM